MDSTSELQWFRGEIWRSLTHPADFARDLAREHYGLAGVLVAIVSGIALSIGIDLLVLASKRLAVGDFVPRLLIDAGLLGMRLAITAAVIAWIANGAVRLLGRRGGSLDQLFTALTFALVPLLLVPVPALLVIGSSMLEVGLTQTLAFAAIVVLALMLRVLVGVALNIRGILPPLVAVVAFVVVLILSSFVLGDEITRMRFLGYVIAPQVVPSLSATPATGARQDMLGFDLTLPSEWRNASTGVRGEAARFESSHATLVVARAAGAALDTADSYANIVMSGQLVGVHDTWHDRSVERINGMIVVDDRYGGDYEGRQVAWRQFTSVPGVQGLALVYRVVEPADRDAAFAEAASIAATWHIAD
ncbi:MAG TPA: YIP1 family protein [Candidatus Limnocylindria bacterium]